MSLSEFVEDVKQREKTLTVFTAADDEQLFEELERFFEVQNITIRRGTVDPDGPQNFVVLHQEGEAVAVSTLEDVRDSLFLGGASSRFPGDIALSEGETPDVINSLGNTTFSADGEDQLLLTQISHYIQELAFESGGGILHVGVRALSDLEASDTTMYEKLSEAGVEVHVYGRPDADPGLDDVVVHGSDAEEVATTQFVAFDGAGEDGRKAAMVAADDGEDYRGFWTFEAGLVDDVTAYLEDAYGQ